MLASALILVGGAAPAQTYPNKPIRMITGEPGGPNDFVIRVITPGLTASMGQQVIVDNRGGGVSAGLTAAKAAPDGYTLLFYGSNIWLAPFLRDSVPWDPVRDFAPITLAASSPNILVVHPSLPVKSAADLIAIAKASPGELNVAAGPAGSTTFLAAELFKAVAGVNIVRVPYKGNVPGLNALVGGQVQLMFANPTAAAAHVKSGRLTALAVTSARPSALLPGLPTVAASGLPGYEAVAILGVFAPARTPATLVNRLNQEIVRVLKQADVSETFLRIGVEPVGSSPKEFAAAMKSEMTRLGKVIRDAGIRDE